MYTCSSGLHKSYAAYQLASLANLSPLPRHLQLPHPAPLPTVLSSPRQLGSPEQTMQQRITSGLVLAHNAAQAGLAAADDLKLGRRQGRGQVENVTSVLLTWSAAASGRARQLNGGSAGQSKHKGASQASSRQHSSTGDGSSSGGGAHRQMCTSLPSGSGGGGGKTEEGGGSEP